MVAFVHRLVRLPRHVLTLYAGLVATVGVVFVVSAVSKARAPWREFADSLRPLGLLPDGLVPVVAVAVAAAELAAAVGLGWTLAATARLAPEVPWVAVGSLIGTGALLGVFTVGIALALRRGTVARCACFGAAEQVLGPRHLARNSVLLLVTAAALVLALGGGPVGDPAAALVGAAGGAVVAVVLIRLDDLVELFVPLTSDQRS
jgi:methylamine utilization protein MauE